MKYEVRFDPYYHHRSCSFAQASYLVVETPSGEVANFFPLRLGPEKAKNDAEKMAAELNDGLKRVGLSDVTPTLSTIVPEAGQVWGKQENKGNFVAFYLLVNWPDDGSWQTVKLSGRGYWSHRRKLAAEAVHGLAFVANSVDSFFSGKQNIARLLKERDKLDRSNVGLLAENDRLYKKITELEKFAADGWSNQDQNTFTRRACEYLRLAPSNEPPTRELVASECQTVNELKRVLAPALAEAAQSAREWRFQASRSVPGWWGVWDNKEAQWEFPPAHQQWDELKARTEAARLNAECSKG